MERHQGRKKVSPCPARTVAARIGVSCPSMIRHSQGCHASGSKNIIRESRINLCKKMYCYNLGLAALAENFYLAKWKYNFLEQKSRQVV